MFAVAWLKSQKILGFFGFFGGQIDQIFAFLSLTNFFYILIVVVVEGSRFLCITQLSSLKTKTYHVDKPVDFLLICVYENVDNFCQNDFPVDNS